jgi:hemolysin III
MGSLDAPALIDRDQSSKHDGYTRREEFAHVLSHGAGFIAAAIGLGLLVHGASTRGTTMHLIGVTVFGTTLLLLYAASTLYHAAPVSTAKRVFQKLDHIAIYLLIAGTYTPFLLIKLPGPWSWVLLAVIWTLAVAGVVLELLRNSPTRRTSVALYLLMGWLIVFSLEQLVRSVQQPGVILLVVGGLVYSVGVIFYAANRLPYNHAVWHGFVLVGSGLHFASVFAFVIP